jgi:hypothetical protein
MVPPLRYQRAVVKALLVPDLGSNEPPVLAHG